MISVEAAPPNATLYLANAYHESFTEDSRPGGPIFFHSFGLQSFVTNPHCLSANRTHPYLLQYWIWRKMLKISNKHNTTKYISTKKKFAKGHL